MSTKNPNKAKRYTQDFIDGALKMVDAGQPPNEVAKSLGINSGAIYYWRDRRGKTKPQARSTTGTQPNRGGTAGDNIDSLKEENLRLKSELKKVTDQRDLLKKTLSLYVQQT